MIEIYLLEQLAGFARYGTLSETAAHLHTSQPALTRSMKSWRISSASPSFTGVGTGSP